MTRPISPSDTVPPPAALRPSGRGAGSGLLVENAAGILHLTLSAQAQGLSRAAATALGRRLRADLARALDGAGPEVRVIILSVEGWDWVLDDDRAGPAVAALDDDWNAICARLCDCGLPVIATVSGVVSGDAVAPLLAAGYVIAQAEARLSLPQAGLGRLPAGGILGRLAARIGAARTLDLALARRSFGARRALALGCVDSVSVPDPGQAALTIARLIASGRQGLPPRSPVGRALADPEPYLDAIAAARGHLGQMRPARARLVARVADVIEAQLLLPGPSAALFEADAWAAQRADPVAAALGHLAWATRQAAMALPRPAKALRLRLVTVLGGTPLAADLSHALISAGFAVTLVAPDGPALAECLRQIAVAQDAAVRHGHLTEDRREQDWARLQAGLEPTRGSGADLVIEASDMTDDEAGRALSQAAAVALRGALLLTARPRDLAQLGRHRPVYGFYLTDPLASGHLVELVLPRGERTAEALGMLSALAQRLGRIAIRVRSGAGGLAQLFREEGLGAIRAGLAAGLSPGALGPCLAALGWSLTLPALPDDAVPQSRHDAEAQARWQEWLVAALANLGARLIEEGVLCSTAEVDLVLTEGAGLARDTGGPMHMADALGLVRLRAILRDRATAGDDAATPSALWDHHIRNARPFTGTDLQILAADRLTA